jgi:hypothetical protein
LKNRNHRECSKSESVPLEEDGLFQSTAEAGLLVAETLTGVAVLSGAINSVTPVEVLVVAMVD